MKQTLIEQIRFVPILILAILVSVLSIPTHTVEASSTGSTCPYTADTNTYVVQFPIKTLFSNQGSSKSFVDAAANIPAGTYDISLFAYDNHAKHGGQMQISEQYKVILYAGDKTLFTSNPSSDIPEKSNTSNTLVNSSAVISETITKIQAKHNGYPNVGKYQSIIPICAQFKKSGTTTPPSSTSLQVTCSVSKSNPSISESITYTATVTGGTGAYTYSWTGARTGTGQSLTTSFPNSGTYAESITVRDASNNTATATCANIVVSNNNITPNLDGSCYANPSSALVNQNIVWTAQASGGNGSYTYTWTGTDGLAGSGNYINKTYWQTGSKTAQVTIVSNGQTITRTCGTNISDIYQPPYYPPYYSSPSYNPVTVSCYANPSSALVNQNIVWTAQASGGNGSYTYTWTGTDGLAYGNASAIQKVYTTPGQKVAYVTVYSNGTSNTATCSTTVIGGTVLGASTVATVIREPSSTAGTPISGVFLSEIPATGISNSLKISLFAIGMILWSLTIAYLIVNKKRAPKFIIAAHSNHTQTLAQRVHAFKQANLNRKQQYK